MIKNLPVARTTGKKALSPCRPPSRKGVLIGQALSAAPGVPQSRREKARGQKSAGPGNYYPYYYYYYYYYHYYYLYYHHNQQQRKA